MAVGGTSVYPSVGAAILRVRNSTPYKLIEYTVYSLFENTDRFRTLTVPVLDGDGASRQLLMLSQAQNFEDEIKNQK